MAWLKKITINFNHDNQDRDWMWILMYYVVLQSKWRHIHPHWAFTIRHEMGLYLLVCIWNKLSGPKKRMCAKWSKPSFIFNLSGQPNAPAPSCKKEEYPLIFFSHGVRRVHLVLRQLFGLLYQPHMTEDDDDCGAIGGMRIGSGNRSTRRKPTPVTLCSPQIPHDLTGARTRAAD
jgi:hypothetical protein